MRARGARLVASAAIGAAVMHASLIAPDARAAAIVNGGSIRLYTFAEVFVEKDVVDRTYGLNSAPSQSVNAAFDSGLAAGSSSVLMTSGGAGSYRFNGLGSARQQKGGARGQSPVGGAANTIRLMFDVTSPTTFTLDLNNWEQTAANGSDPTYGITLTGHNVHVNPASPQAQAVLSPGAYTFSWSTTASDNSYQNNQLSFAYDFSIGLSDAVEAPGFSQGNPVMPTPPGGGGGGATPPGFTFVGGRSGAWFDPTPADGYDFVTIDGSLFTDVLGFPTGFAEEFEVIAGGQSLGLFGPNDAVNFAAILGAGVSSFQIRNINPTVDGEDPTAFPIQLAFNTATADFTMTPVPEPSGVAVVLSITGLGALLSSCRGGRRRGRRVC